MSYILCCDLVCLVSWYVGLLVWFSGMVALWCVGYCLGAVAFGCCIWIGCLCGRYLQRLPV